MEKATDLFASIILKMDSKKIPRNKKHLIPNYSPKHKGSTISIYLGLLLLLMLLFLFLIPLPEIILLDDVTILYKSVQDLYFYVIGASTENEILLLSVLESLLDALSTLLRYIGFPRSYMY